MAYIRFLHTCAEYVSLQTAASVLALGLCATSASLDAQGAPRATARNNAPSQLLMVSGRYDPSLKSADITEVASPGRPTSQVTLKTRIPGSGLTSLTGVMSHDERSLEMLKGEAAGSPAGSVQIETLNYNQQPVSILTLLRPHIQEVDLPTLAGDSKDPIYFTIKFFPATSETTAPSQAPPATLETATHVPLASDFMLSIDGIDCRKVARVILPVISAPRPSGQPAFSAVVVDITESADGPFQQWLTSNGPKNGVLAILAPDLKTPLYLVKLHGLRIQTIAAQPRSGIARTEVTMSVANVETGEP